MKIVEILQAVSIAYKDFKNAYEQDKTTDELFSVFEKSLSQSLGEY